jgi:prepilin-type N-terminal cleavage/methylation domain-containing protein
MFYNPQDHRKQAFSLVELLVVMAIASVLLGLAVAAFSNFGRAGNLSKTAGDLSSLLELARTHAMANNTTVEVGLVNTTDGVMAAVIANRQGTNTNFTQLGQIRTFPNTRIEEIPEGSRPESDFVPGTSGGGLGAFSLRGRNYDMVIQFNSRGEARAEAGRLSRVIEIGIYSSVNGVVPENLRDNFAAIQISGLSGSVQVFRP